MRHKSSNPMDTYHSQIERENFLQEQKEKKEFLDSVKEIAESAKLQSDIALKTSKKADVKGWIAVIISLISLVLEIADRLCLF